MKTIKVIETKHYTLALIQQKDLYYVIRSTKQAEHTSGPMRDARLALNAFDDFLVELQNTLQ